MSFAFVERDEEFRLAVIGLLGLDELMRVLINEVRALKEGQEKLSRTLENITISIEDEANELVQYLLR